MPAPTTAKPAPMAAILPVMFCYLCCFYGYYLMSCPLRQHLIFVGMRCVLIGIAKRRSDEEGRKQGKNICLQHRDQHLEHVNEQGKGDGDRSYIETLEKED